MPDLRERRDETKIRSIRRRAPKRTAPKSRPRRPTATEKATAHPTVSVHEPTLTDCPLMSASLIGRSESISDIPACQRDVCFSNRPVGVKRFQTIHDCGVDVAHGLVLLSGLGTMALPSWDSKMRRNNLYRGL